MVIGAGVIVLRLHGCRSLKGKRKIVKAIIARMRNQFNASVAEVDLNDVHQRAQIGFCTVANSQALVNAKIEHLFEFVESLGLAEVIERDMEIIVL